MKLYDSSGLTTSVVLSDLKIGPESGIDTEKISKPWGFRMPSLWDIFLKFTLTETREEKASLLVEIELRNLKRIMSPDPCLKLTIRLQGRNNFKLWYSHFEDALKKCNPIAKSYLLDGVEGISEHFTEEQRKHDKYDELVERVKLLYLNTMVKNANETPVLCGAWGSLVGRDSFEKEVRPQLSVFKKKKQPLSLGHPFKMALLK